MKNLELKILDKQPTQENPYVVENYPYGFRLRTQIKYWVETTKNGQRFIRQTLNPKTNLWNKPKKSTYSQIILVGLNEEEHITYTCLSMYSIEEALRFKEKYEKYLNDYQKTELVNIIKMLEVYNKVEYKITASRYRHKVTGIITNALPLMDMDNYYEVDEEGNAIFDIQKEEEEKEQKEINRKINKMAILNAGKKTSIGSALKTFKRVK